MDNSEQWLIDGDCEECRKKAYCKNDCKKATERKRQEQACLIHECLSRTKGGRAMIDVMCNLLQRR